MFIKIERRCSFGNHAYQNMVAVETSKMMDTRYVKMFPDKISRKAMKFVG